MTVEEFAQSLAMLILRGRGGGVSEDDMEFCLTEAIMKELDE